MTIKLTLVEHPVLGEACVITHAERGEDEALRVAKEAIAGAGEGNDPELVKVVGDVTDTFGPFDLMFGPYLLGEPDVEEEWQEFLEGLGEF